MSMKGLAWKKQRKSSQGVSRRESLSLGCDDVHQEKMLQSYMHGISMYRSILSCATLPCHLPQSKRIGWWSLPNKKLISCWSSEKICVRMVSKAFHFDDVDLSYLGACKPSLDHVRIC